MGGDHSSCSGSGDEVEVAAAGPPGPASVPGSPTGLPHCTLCLLPQEHIPFPCHSLACSLSLSDMLSKLHEGKRNRKVYKFRDKKLDY